MANKVGDTTAGICNEPLLLLSNAGIAVNGELKRARGSSTLRMLILKEVKFQREKSHRAMVIKLVHARLRIMPPVKKATLTPCEAGMSKCKRK